jgi:hypothetical protein
LSIRRFLIVCILGVLICGRTPAWGQAAGDERLEAIFSGLRLIHFGLEFPYTEEALENCRNVKDETCLATYDRAKSAKVALLRRPREEALQLTLATIAAACDRAELDVESPCPGAVTALYFFSTPPDDRTIQAFLSSAPLSTVNQTLEQDTTWLRNRADKRSWRDWLDRTALSSDQKRQIGSALEQRRPIGQTIDEL